jgi:hypothetical protein
MKRRWLVLAMQPLAGLTCFIFLAGCAGEVGGLVSTTTDSPLVCELPRPELCAALYDPVCGVTKDGGAITYSSGCRACSEITVISHTAGACEATLPTLD